MTRLLVFAATVSLAALAVGFAACYGCAKGAV